MHFANCANCAAQFGSSWSWKRALQDGHVERRCCKRLEASFRPTVSAGEPVVMREGRVGFAHDADLHFAAPQLQPAACACTLHAPQLQRNADQGDSPDRCRGCLCSGVVHAPALPMHMDGVLHALGHLGSISACVVTTLQLAPFGRVRHGSRSSTVRSDGESPRPALKTFLGSLGSSSRVLIRGMHWSERLGHMESWRVALQLDEDSHE